MTSTLIINKNIIIEMNDYTNKPTNNYWLGAHYAKQFPHEWAYMNLPGTGRECEYCKLNATWCGVFIGYCSYCAPLYNGERGPGFILPGIEFDENDIYSANNTYMANVEWRHVGYSKLLEGELRRYLYKKAHNELVDSMAKACLKIVQNWDENDGPTQKKIAQLGKKRQLRKAEIDRQKKKSIDIEKKIYSELWRNEMDCITANKKDIIMIDKSIDILTRQVGKLLREPIYWYDDKITPLGEEKTAVIYRRIALLERQKGNIEKDTDMHEVEKKRIDKYIEVLCTDVLVPRCVEAHVHSTACYNDVRLTTFQDTISLNESYVAELDFEIEMLRAELKEEAEEAKEAEQNYVEWWWIEDLNYGGGRRKQKFHYQYSNQCKTEKDREQERLNVLGITPQNWAYRNMQCTPLDEWTDDESDEDN